MQSSTLLIRHGHVDSPMGPTGPRMYGSQQPLNKIGERQMVKFGESLNAKNITPDVIYTSPFPRAVQSAQILSNELPNHPNVVIRDGLRGGSSPQWEGRPISELANVKEDIFSPNPHQPDIHGETLTDAYSRVIKEYQQIVDINPNAAIVTHGEIVGIIRHYEQSGDKDKPGIDQPIGKAEGLLIHRNEGGLITKEQLITPEIQPSLAEMKK